jgi:hypothetical protein
MNKKVITILGLILVLVNIVVSKDVSLSVEKERECS